MTKGAISMTAQQCKTTLTIDDNDHNCLAFSLPSGEKRLDLDDETNEQQILDLFNSILSSLIENDIIFELEVPESKKGSLYDEVANAYISQLNEELNRVKDKMEKYNISPNRNKAATSSEQD